MKGDKQDMFEKKKWVIVGVTDKKDRFGYKIWKLLRNSGYEVYGVNPRLDELDGVKIYDEIKDLPETPDVLNMIVNPKLAKPAMEQAKEKGITDIFFQPGSYDEDILQLADDMGFTRVTDCVYASLA